MHAVTWDGLKQSPGKARDWTATEIKNGWRAVKDHFGDNKPHFSFITAHYLWIVSAVIVGSILIYGGGKGEYDYIDCLLFAAGANTQAGLNPIDLNLLNTFQQVVIYFFSMASCPITLHGCVVFLRLYWFEKRFQHWVKDAKAKRGTLSKGKSTTRGEDAGLEEGVRGRNITVVPRDGRSTRITNDGIVLTHERDDRGDGDDEEQPSKPGLQGSDSSGDSNTVQSELAGYEMSALPKIDESRSETQEDEQQGDKLERETSPRSQPQSPEAHQTAISFADHVVRSDVPDDARGDKLHPMIRPHADHIAFLERQRRNEAARDDVLRIPGPREAERGQVPRRLARDDDDEDHHSLAPTQTWDSRGDASQGNPRAARTRQPTITIAEPEQQHKRDGFSENAAAVGGTVDALRLRKPRALNHGQHTLHEHNEHNEHHGHNDNHHNLPAARTRTLGTIRSFLTRDRELEDMPYLSYNPTMGRNSNFVGLTLEQREELGGVEYRSLRTLALIILGYFWGFQILSLTCMLPYIKENQHYRNVVEDFGVGTTWWAFWTANSAFMDLGFTLTPDSMASFAKSQFVLMIMTFFIIIGNTGFPVMLRFIIWLISKVVPKGSGLWEELRFLLDHPRRCFTLLFPSSPTWWLFWILVILNVIDLVFFIILDLHTPVVSDLKVSTRIVNGLFQSASTRTAGFSSLSLSDLKPAMPVLYMVMMYISVFPIAISIRRTNVYEERSLGMYHDKKDDDAADDARAGAYIGLHMRRQLSFDLWFVALGFFFVAISEGDKIQRGEFNLFDVLFEIVSAYGTVGLSMGVPNVNASLCSQFGTVGKLIIISMMIRGRHRGLPYGLDRAVLLPSESRFEQEAGESDPVLVRTATGRTGRTSVDARRASSTGRARSLSRGRELRDRNIVSSLLFPGPSVTRAETMQHRRATSTASQHHPNERLPGVRLSQVHSQPIIDSDMESLAATASREPVQTQPRRAETAPMGPKRPSVLDY